MPLPQEVQEQIQTLVRAGFEDADNIAIALTEDTLTPSPPATAPTTPTRMKPACAIEE